MLLQAKIQISSSVNEAALCKIITQLRFDDALNRANTHALGRIVVTFAFHAGFLIDHVQNAIAFANGLGWTFGDACAAGDAIFKNFHGHGSFSVKRFVADINYRHAMLCVN
jgi:hypothetical protein